VLELGGRGFWIYRKGAEVGEGREVFWMKRNAELRRTRRKTRRESWEVMYAVDGRWEIGDGRWEMGDGSQPP
jgi:hypothetical protein